MLRGQEIVKNRREIIADLNRALAAELADAYRYRFLALWASGLKAELLAKLFAEMSEHEWAHAGTFMKRIIQLGGRPLQRLSEVEKLSYALYKNPPRDPTNLRAMLEDSLKGEQAAIDFYASMLRKLRETDPLTYHIIRESLEDEVEDEQRLAAMLGKM